MFLFVDFMKDKINVALQCNDLELLNTIKTEYIDKNIVFFFFEQNSICEKLWLVYMVFSVNREQTIWSIVPRRLVVSVFFYHKFCLNTELLEEII